MNWDILMNYLSEYSQEELFYYRNQQESGRQPAAGEAASPSSDMLSTALMNTETGVKRTARLSRLCRYAPSSMHTHDFFEILYVLKGSCQQQIGKVQCPLAEGELCLLSPHTVHSVSASGSDLVISIQITVQTIENLFSTALCGKNTVSDFLRNAVFLKNYASYLIFRTAEDAEIREQILYMFMEEFQAAEYADCIISHMIMIFLIRLIRKYKKMAEGPAFNPPVFAKTAYIFQYIQENYETASLTELSKKLNYSVPYCSKYVRTCTGFSFSQLQKRIRMQKAADYLMNTDLTIERISELIGYSNPENFMRMFKNVYKISPSQYRSRQRSNEVI